MNNVSNRFRIARHFDEALGWSSRAIELARSLDQPGQLAGLLQGTAFIHRDRGDLEAALTDAREAAQLFESMPGRSPNDASVALPLSLALARVGIILGDPDGISLNRPADAIAPLEQSFAIADDLAHKDPNDAQSIGRVQTAGAALVRITRDSDPQQALSRCDHMLTHFGPIKNNPQMRRFEARAEADAVHPLLRLGRIDEARERLKIAFSRLNDLKLYPRAEIEPGSEAAVALRASAEIEARSGNLSRALEIDNALLEQIEKSKPEPEEDLSDALDLSRLLSALADLNTAAHLPDRAAAQQHRRLELWQHWDRKLPGNAFVQRQRDAAIAESHFK